MIVLNKIVFAVCLLERNFNIVTSYIKYSITAPPLIDYHL